MTVIYELCETYENLLAWKNTCHVNTDKKICRLTLIRDQSINREHIFLHIIY